MSAETINVSSLVAGAINVNGTVTSGVNTTITAANGAITINQDVTGLGVTVTSTASTIDVNAEVSGTNFVALTSSGTLTVGALGDVNGNNVGLTSNAGSVSIGGVVTGTGANNQVSVISFNDITSATGVGNITADALLLQSNNGNIGAAGVGNSIRIDSANVSEVSLNSNNDTFVTVNGDILLVNSVIGGNLSIESVTTNGGVLTVGNAVQVVGDASFTLGTNLNAGGNLVVSSTGSIVAANVDITTFNGTLLNGDVSLSGSVNATANVVILAEGDITTSGAAVSIGGASVSLNAIGDITAQTTTGSLTIGAANATITNFGSVSLQASSTTGILSLTTDATNGGDITVAGLVTADVLNLTATSGTGINGDITLNAGVTGSSNMNLNADGSINGSRSSHLSWSMVLAAGTGIGTSVTPINVTNGASGMSLGINASWRRCIRQLHRNFNTRVADFAS